MNLIWFINQVVYIFSHVKALHIETLRFCKILWGHHQLPHAMEFHVSVRCLNMTVPTQQSALWYCELANNKALFRLERGISTANL